MATARGTRPFSGMAGVEQAWGSDSYLVAIAEQSGMNAIDLETLRDFCKEHGLLLVIRSPGGIGRNIMGMGGVPIRPKPASIKNEKTGGKWIKKDGTYFISDYDLLSVWRRAGDGFVKVPLCEDDPRTDEFLKKINREMVMPFQHGANDDWLDCEGKAKNTAIGNHFTVVPDDGLVIVIDGQDKMRAYYEKHGLSPWLYG